MTGKDGPPQKRRLPPSFNLPLVAFGIVLLLAVLYLEKDAVAGFLDVRHLPKLQPPGVINFPAATPTSTAVPPTPSPTMTPTPTPVVPSPLTGLPVNDPESLRQRPIAVKIDNAPGARPQSGLAQAGAVYEHLAEGGLTRFTAFYLTENAEVIGPVRSARLVDLQLAREYGAVLAHVGASQPIMQMLRDAADIFDLDQWWYPEAYYRGGGRYAPYNVYTSTGHLRSLSKKKGWEKQVELPRVAFAGAPTEPPGDAVGTIDIRFEQTHIRYQYDEGSNAYLRFTDGVPHTDAESGEQLKVTNLVVQYVDTVVTDIVEDAQGARSLDFGLTGEGRVEVFHDGRIYAGRWVRKTAKDKTELRDESGNPISLRPGNTWITLLPNGMETSKE